jgi:ketosteroid isomerase-like protein
VVSEENLEIVRMAVEAYARGDLDTALANADPDIAWMNSPKAPRHSKPPGS